MPTEVRLPNLGENVDSGDVLSILVQEGDEIRADQGILELETDKATMEVPSPSAGRVTKIHVSEGQTVPIGTLIITLESAEAPAEAQPAAAPPAEKKEAPKKEKAPQAKVEPAPKKEAEKPAAAPSRKAPAAAERDEEEEEEAAAVATAAKPAEPPRAPVEDVPGDGHASAAAGPAVRRLARELGVDLRRVRGTGEGNRITREDVQAHVREANIKVRSKEIAGPVPPGEAATDSYGPVRREKMSRMRQTIARNMLNSYSTVPQLTNFDDADITELERMRQESKDDYAKRGIKLTTMPFLVKAIASALKLHPVINASVDMESNQVIYKEYVNIGIAVDTERGLLVPVLRDADEMNIPQIAHALAQLSDKARSGETQLDDLRGGTFTISNLGAIGGTYSTPIINPPEVAILLVGRSRKLPVYVGDELVGRLMMPLSLTYDHRVVDGAAAARFLNDVKNYLTAPGKLLLAP